MASLEEALDPPIEIAVDYRSPIEFRTPLEIREWIDAEEAFWRDINEKITARNPLPNVLKFDALFRDISNIKNDIEQLTAADDNNKHQPLQNLRSHFSNYTSHEHIYRDSPVAVLISELADDQPSAAWVEIFKWREGKKNIRGQDSEKISFSEIVNAYDFLEAWKEAELGSIDYKKAKASQERSLNALRNRWVADLEKRNSEWKTNSDQISERYERLEKLGIRSLRTYRALKLHHRTKMESMQQAFSTEMRLRAAEKFWGEKRKINRQRERLAFTRLCWIGGVGLIAILFMFWLLYRVFGEPQSLNVSQALVFFVPTVLYLWLLRILATEYRTNKNMADDAEERTAMVMTFKALEYDGKVGDEERLVILNALFRPHGHAGEESVPTPVWDAVITKLGK